MNCCILSVLPLVLFDPLDHVERALCSFSLDKCYIVTITDRALRKSPAWVVEAENPPLSAQKAIRLANEKRARLVEDTYDWKWEIETVSLNPAREGRWYWVVEYKAHFRGHSTGIPPFLKLAVLMDGTVVEPTVTDDDINHPPTITPKPGPNKH
jgi:hypothetical protein